MLRHAHTMCLTAYMTHVAADTVLHVFGYSDLAAY